ncbi:DUF86 domain-containing protein [Dehalococcoidia bacterium]|nr:DUF86 domain-containing protein [Dehalococcoidia bacterium]
MKELLYIKDIVEYMERAEKHLEDFKKEEFFNDDKTCDAVIRCIEVIGEATKNVPVLIRNRYPAIPWRDMAGMRDKIIHGYFVVDFETVWLVVKEEFPKLKPGIQKILEDLES